MLIAIMLGLVQGLTEFLPVSSTAHLVLLRWFMHWGGEFETLSFDVALHAGTLLSLLVYFYKDIIDILKNDRRFAMLIIIGSVPAGIAGVLLDDIVENNLRLPGVIAFSLVVFGALMIYAQKFSKDRPLSSISLKDVLIIGLAQAVALIPGVSRSGVTITAALMLGLSRENSARISFFLSMPIITGAVILHLKKLIAYPMGHDFGLFGAGLSASFVSGLFAIKFLLGYVRRNSLNVFSYYRFALAVAILATIWIRT